MGNHRVSIRGVPRWVPVERLLGSDWTLFGDAWTKEVNTSEAADLAARLRKLSIGGSPVEIDVRPSLKRNAIRQGRLDEARRRREGSVGFSRQGVRLDEEGRYSLTPEKIAYGIGRQTNGGSVLDACCGAGGNAIGFARAGCQVVAVDTHLPRLQMARHNAKLYGVEQRITFIHGDVASIQHQHPADVLFIDPPWGEWDPVRCTVDDFPILKRLVVESPVRTKYKKIWAKVPSSFDPTTIDSASPEAIFGVNPGDSRHIKFLLLRLATAKAEES